MNNESIISFINTKINEDVNNPSLTTRDYALKKEAYQSVINYILNKYKNTFVELAKHDTYEVDYNCPDRKSFIESVEKSV